jgi:hypothetical protein
VVLKQTLDVQVFQNNDIIGFDQPGRILLELVQPSVGRVGFELRHHPSGALIVFEISQCAHVAWMFMLVAGNFSFGPNSTPRQLLLPTMQLFAQLLIIADQRFFLSVGKVEQRLESQIPANTFAGLGECLVLALTENRRVVFANGVLAQRQLLDSACW